jgi:hypothetical protein
MKRLALARHLASQGFCVIPLGAGCKKPAVRWKRFQTERPTDADLVAWFQDQNYWPAIVTGAVSGITVIDCDSRGAADAWAAGGSSSPLRQTTKRGMHFVYRWAGERNTVRVEGMAGVDRRGEGGYVAAYPESVHWTREAVEAAPTLTAGERVCEDVKPYFTNAFDDDADDAGEPEIPMPEEAAVWDDDRDCWRVDYVEDGQPPAVYQAPPTHAPIEVLS